MALEFRVLELLPFLPLRTAIVVTEKLKPNARSMFAEAVQRKLGWYGADLLGVEEGARPRPAGAAPHAHPTGAGARPRPFAGASPVAPPGPPLPPLGRARRGAD